MKFEVIKLVIHHALGRAPHGARGLKCRLGQIIREKLPSRPARGAWIEIG